MELRGQLCFLQQNDPPRVRHLPCRNARRAVQGRRRARQGTRASAGTGPPLRAPATRWAAAVIQGLRRAHRPGAPPRHRRRRGRSPLQPATDRRAGRPGPPRLRHRLSKATPVSGPPERRNRPFAHAAASSWARSRPCGTAGPRWSRRTAWPSATGPELLHPSGSRTVRLGGMKNANGEAIDVARRQPVPVRIPWTARPTTRGPPAARGVGRNGGLNSGRQRQQRLFVRNRAPALQPPAREASYLIASRGQWRDPGAGRPAAVPGP